MGGEQRSSVTALGAGALSLALALTTLASATSGESRAEVEVTDDVTTRLHSFEESRRATTDFSRTPSWEKMAGADPIRVVALEGATGPHAVGLLRNASSVVVLDGALGEVERLAAPRSPTGLAVRGNFVYVCGEASTRIARYRFAGGHLEPAGAVDVDDVLGLRDIAAGGTNVLYAVDERGGNLITLVANEHSFQTGRSLKRLDLPIGVAPFLVASTGAHVVVDDLLGHSISILPIDSNGIPTLEGSAKIHHDGPIWSFAAKESARGLVIAAGGVEDRPLDRSGGFFGSIDSFVFVYRVNGSEAKRLAEENVSALGVITPKALALDLDAHDAASIFVTGYGGDRAARIRWSDRDFDSSPAIFTYPLEPGSSAIADIGAGKFIIANSLFDAWSIVRADGIGESRVVVRDGAAPRSIESRVGEALFFTSLMAPRNSSEGTHSRFTCETCHFEGYVDGRTHFTGRGDVHATTKPLRGLFNNRPHFSRALDPNLTSVSLNEFRVAGAGNDEDAWFDVNSLDFPWIRDLGVDEDSLSAEDLRHDLIAFLIDFSHSENPATLARAEFTERERTGAELFRARCEGCHEARLIADSSGSRVDFARWQELVFSDEDPIVWGRDTYEQTGVVPYVHERGARVPSLRRLFKKRPYFTNGTAPDIANVLERARFDGAGFFHEGGPANASELTPLERSRLADFLELL